MTKLIDTYGRVHRDLRVSLTDRCNLRCTYCMPADFNNWLPNDELLTTNELMTVLQVAVDSGITEVRLTGGEPLLRPDIVEIVKQISACLDDFLRKHVLFSVYPKIWKGYNNNNHKVT